MKKILTTFDYYLDYVIRTSGADEKIHSISTDYYFGIKENCRKYTHTALFKLTLLNCGNRF